MCQHDFRGRRVFQHRNLDKWDLLLRNQRIKGFRFEDECREFVRELGGVWDGFMSAHEKVRPRRPARRVEISRGPVSIAACMISCAQRKELRENTRRALAATGWPGPLLIQLEEHVGGTSAENLTADARRALERGLATRAEYVLLLEDDLEFNAHFHHNLQCWAPLRAGAITLAGFYNPGHRALAADARRHALIVEPTAIYGSQAMLLSRAALKFALRHWDEVAGPPDLKLPRLAARLGPIYYHSPSLVQHIGRTSTWGGAFHQAQDFDRQWKAGEAASLPGTTPDA